MGPERRFPRFPTIPSLSWLRLRPYGDSLLTPAVRVWLGFAGVVILLMASIEGIVWGFVGASIVPAATPWLRPVAGLFLFALMFAIIWIVDASLVMSERPIRVKSAVRLAGADERGAGVRWFFGILVRVLIVAVSLYVTAPFLAKLIRSDDIESYHQRLVEAHYSRRDAAFEAKLADRSAETRAHYAGLIPTLEDEIAQLNRRLDDDRRRLAEIEAEYAPEVKVLRAELTAARERLGDEIHGRGDRPEGYGPEARKWDARAKSLEAALAEKQAEIDGRLADLGRAIAEREERLRERTQALEALRSEQRERLDRLRAEVASEQPEDVPPRLTFAARSKALQAIRESPDEAGVPHFETVEGFAQAALGILFFALLALKLFEPAAVRAYFDESLQFRYRRYLEGGLADIPGFEYPEDPAQRLSPVDFARWWRAYELDPAGFFAARQAHLEAAEPLRTRRLEQAFAETLLERRRENLEEELDLARRRRELELDAYREEQGLRTDALRAQLDDDGRAKEAQRRLALRDELQRARESWALEKAQGEADLRERMAAFERSIELAREDRRLREKDMEIRRAQRDEELRQADRQRRHRHEVERAELEARRRRDERAQRLAALRDELDRLRDQESRQGDAARAWRENGYRLADVLGVLDARIAATEGELASLRRRIVALRDGAGSAGQAGLEVDRVAGGGFWARATRSDEKKPTGDTKRELKALRKSLEAAESQLARQHDERRALELERITGEGRLAEALDRLAGLQARIGFHEDAIGALLAHDLSDAQEPAPGAGSPAA